MFSIPKSPFDLRTAMSGTQLSFSLRLSSGIKTVHLLGSWDNYVGQLPLSKDKSASKGTWKGTFRFSNSALPPGQRYWYYYIIDGYHTVHNPSEPSTVEPTTGRSLNVLDVGSKSHRSSGKSSSSKHQSSSKDKHHHDRSDRHHHSSSKRDIPKGRPLSVSQIQQPMPVSPHATKHILETDYMDEEQLDHLTARFGSARLVDDEYEPDDYGGDYYVGYENDGYGGGGSSSSPSGSSPLSSSVDDSSYMATSSGSDVSIRSDSSSPTGTSSLSGYSTPNSDVSSHCTCQRYGITRKGERVKMNCGGSRCGYGGASSGDSASSCSSSGDEADHSAAPRSSARRHGVVVRR